MHCEWHKGKRIARVGANGSARALSADIGRQYEWPDEVPSAKHVLLRFKIQSSLPDRYLKFLTCFVCAQYIQTHVCTHTCSNKSQVSVHCLSAAYSRPIRSLSVLIKQDVIVSHDMYGEKHSWATPTGALPLLVQIITKRTTHPWIGAHVLFWLDYSYAGICMIALLWLGWK